MSMFSGVKEELKWCIDFGGCFGVLTALIGVGILVHNGIEYHREKKQLATEHRGIENLQKNMPSMPKEEQARWEPEYKRITENHRLNFLKCPLCTERQKD